MIQGHGNDIYHYVQSSTSTIQQSEETHYITKEKSNNSDWKWFPHWMKCKIDTVADMLKHAALQITCIEHYCRRKMIQRWQPYSESTKHCVESGINSWPASARCSVMATFSGKVSRETMRSLQVILAAKRLRNTTDVAKWGILPWVVQVLHR